VKNINSVRQILLDTNAFLYFINDDSVLSDENKSLIESQIEILISIASLWEIAIKLSIGKLSLPDTFSNFIPLQLEKNSIDVLPITLIHLEGISSLPFHHKDPFDRLIISQSIEKKIPIMSSDKTFDFYNIERIW